MSDSKRIYVASQAKALDEEPSPVISIDDTIKEGLTTVRRIVVKIRENTARGVIPDREVVMTLKDCMSMLWEARKKEQELLEDMSEAELQKMLVEKK